MVGERGYRRIYATCAGDLASWPAGGAAADHSVHLGAAGEADADDAAGLVVDATISALEVVGA